MYKQKLIKKFKIVSCNAGNFDISEDTNRKNWKFIQNNKKFQSSN